MKIIRYQNSLSHIAYGWLAPDGKSFEIAGDISGLTRPDRPADVAKLLAPVAPTGFFCIGLNYRQHADETKATIPELPISFIKRDQRGCRIPAIRSRFLPRTGERRGGLRMRAGGRHRQAVQECVARERAWITCSATLARMMSARATGRANGAAASGAAARPSTPSPRSGRAWSRQTKSRIRTSLKIRTVLNGEIMQDWNTARHDFDVPALIEFLSGSTTLLPGTVILTGTPQGVGMACQPQRWLAAGDSVVIEIEGIGQAGKPGGKRNVSIKYKCLINRYVQLKSSGEGLEEHLRGLIAAVVRKGYPARHRRKHSMNPVAKSSGRRVVHSSITFTGKNPPVSISAGGNWNGPSCSAR